MITEMFIEGLPVDVSESFSTLLTFQLADIKEPGTKATAMSKTLILPGTSRNDKLFGHYFVSENNHDASLPNILNNFNPAKSARCLIFQGNIQVFKGTFKLLEVIEDRGRMEYEAQVVGELGGFVSTLGNRKLEDIDFTPFIDNYDLDYTTANITGSWGHIGVGDGLYYPLIDYGNASTNKHDWDYHTFKPALYVKDYLDKIFYYAGYSYVCPLFDTARFKTWIVPHNQKQLTTLNSTLASWSDSTPQDVYSSPYQVRYDIHTGAFTANVAETEFTFTGLTTTLHLKWSASGTTQGVEFQFKLYVNGVFKLNLDQPVSGVGFAHAFASSYDDDLPFSLTTGDVVTIKAIRIETVGIAPFITVSSTSAVWTSDRAQQVPISLGESFSIQDIIPKGVLQKEFFSSILKMFNLYVYDDKYDEKVLKITPYIDFYDTDPATFIDWTYKLDRSKPVRVRPMSELNARYYDFKFKADSDYYNDLYNKRYNETYGSRTYDSAYEFASESAPVEVVFAGTPLVGYQSEDKVYSTIFKKSGTTEETIDSCIRILQAKHIGSVDSWNIKDGSTDLLSLTSYGYAGHLDDPDAPANDLNFGVPKELFFSLATGALNVNQFNVYYSSYFAEICDPNSRLFIATFRLTTRDIEQLDFSKFIYIDGSLYRLVKIEDYNASNEDTCKVTLLKVINLLY